MKNVYVGCLLVLALPLAAVCADAAEAEKPAVCAVLGGDILLGGAVDGRWAADEDVAPHLRGGEEYQLFTLTKRIGQATVSKPKQGVEEEDPCPWTFRAEITPMPEVEEEFVAVNATWDPLPRAPKLESTDQKVYQDLVRDVLQMHRIAKPKVNITRVVRIDLEGDGTDEVLITATNDRPNRIMAFDPQEGDYSLVLLRKIVGADVKTVIVAGEFFPQEGDEGEATPNILTIPAVLDANGDGVMEIFVAWKYHEGNGMDAFEVKGIDVKRIFGSGWGV